VDRGLARRLVEVCRQVGGAPAIAVLRPHLGTADADLRGRVLAALDALAYTARDAADRAALAALVQDEVREATCTLGALRDLGDAAAELEPLRAALADEVAAAGQRVFALLACMHDRTSVHRVAANIARGAKDKRAYAHEVLDLLLEPAERELVTPLVDDAPLADRLRKLGARFPQPVLAADAQLRALATRDARALRSFPRALARRALDQTAESPLAKDPAMLLIEKVLMLKTVPMFAKTSEDVLAEMAGLFEEVEYRAGETIFAKGDVGESMYLIVSGRVRVFDGDTKLSELAGKEIFGELALLDPQPRSASVMAIEDARLFRLDGETFSQLMAGNLEIVRGVLHVLCERLRRTSASAGGV
jgi:hypothetical protein